MGTYYTGTSGDLTFASIALIVTTWKFNDESTEIDLTNKGSGGFHALTTGIRTGSIECEALYDSTISYGTAPPVIRSGKTGAFTLTVASGKTLTGNAIVTSCDYTHDLDGVFKYSLKLKTNGAFKVPNEA